MGIGPGPVPTTELQISCIEEILHRIASDLSMIADRPMTLEILETYAANARPVGPEKIHISFRLGFKHGEEVDHGCLLIPMPDAITLACSLMMMQEDAILQARERRDLDATLKDAMLEVGNFVCGAADAAMRALAWEDVRVCFEGCQGVLPDVRPALIYEMITLFQSPR